MTGVPAVSLGRLVESGYDERTAEGCRAAVASLVDASRLILNATDA